MSTWILIAMLGGYGFTAEFADQQACENARQHVLKGAMSEYSHRRTQCLPKSSKREVAK